MLYFKHRINTSNELRNCEQQYGLEIDVRSNTNGKLYLHHDPMKKGEKLDEWLQHYKHNGLILNVKEEGLELPCIDLMQKYQIDNYFFLDASIPFILKYRDNANVKSCIRVSEYEPDSCLSQYKEFANWLWLDSFHQFFYSEEQLVSYAKFGFKTCIVSPELQGRCITEADEICKKIDVASLVTAVCTKQPDYWERVIDA
jgi:hypothetical protein